MDSSRCTLTLFPQCPVWGPALHVPAGDGQLHLSTAFPADLHDLGWTYFLLSPVSSFSFWGAALFPMAPLAALVTGEPSSPLVEGL